MVDVIIINLQKKCLCIQFYSNQNPNIFDKAIIVIRNPLQSFIAETNRILTGGSPIRHASIAQWKNITYVDNFTEKFLPFWKKIHHRILDNKFQKPIHLVQFEDMKTNLIGELTKILEFLKMEMNSEIEECILQDPNGIYKRPQRSKEELDIILSKFTESHLKQASEAYEYMIHF